MAVANPCLQKGWDEWKKETEENRRRKWRERVKVEVNSEEEEEEDYVEDKGSEEEEVREGEGEEEREEDGKAKEEDEMEEESEQEEEGGKKVEREAKMYEEKNREVEEAQDMEGEEEEGENEGERKVKENKEVDIEQGRKLKEAEEMVEENVEEEWEEKKVMREEVVKETEEVEEGKENDVEREVKVNEEVDEEAMKEVMETEVVGIGVGRKVRGSEEMVERERAVREVEQWEEVGELDKGIEVMANEVVYEEEDREGKNSGKNEEPEEPEEPKQEQIGHYDYRAQIRAHVNGRRFNEDGVHENQERTVQEHEAIKEENNFSYTVKFNNEDPDWTGAEDQSVSSKRIKNGDGVIQKQHEDPKELQDPDEKSRRNERSILGAWSSKNRKEEEGERELPTDEEETVTEELQEDGQDSTDEEAEESVYEGVDCYDEDVVKIYCKDNYPMHVFRTLTEFRDSSLLTDLNLKTEDGKSFHVHSLVLAAVSSLIWDSLSRNSTENGRIDKIKDDNTDDDTVVGNSRWSMSLGPEVDHVGVEAVVEFAYSGHISCLNKETLERIKAAAETLGAPRVLDLCTEEENAKIGGQMKEERNSAAEQMRISLQSIKRLWVDRMGCDVILEAIGKSLHVKCLMDLELNLVEDQMSFRVILAVSSDYFRGMFTLGMRESNEPCVTLPFLLASELEVLISCSYSGALPLSWSSVFEITSTALQLQYQPALSLCLDFLQQEINPHSCLDVVSFAEAYEMVQLLEVAHDFVLRQFQKVACTLKFRDMPAKQLLRYLNSHSLCVPSELVVFKAVVAWIQAKPKKRLELANELMKTIHFSLMTFSEFKEVQSLRIWSDHSLVELYAAVLEDFCSNETESRSQCRIYLPKESLVLIGGDQISEDLGHRSISRELWFGNSLRNHTGIKKAMEWKRLGEMPEPARFSHEVAVLKEQLYVFGGKKYYGINDTLNSVYRYDPCQNSWENLAEMQEKRCSFSGVVLDGKIYAVGGHCSPEYIASVERYCPTMNSWSFTCPLDVPLSGHVAKVLQGQIFVSGGLNSDHRCLASTFLYHPETGSTYLANMTEPRAHHCMESLGDCLYVAGGITTDKNMAIVDQLACEVYDPAADSWTAFTCLQVPHVGAGSAVLEGKFYVLGGYSQEDYSDTKMVHRYDPTMQRWENMGKMPGPNNDIRASLLYLPPHLRL